MPPSRANSKICKMLSLNPKLPLTGASAVRYKVDCRKRNHRERVMLIEKYAPEHLVRTGHCTYLSHEAYFEPIESLRKLPNEPIAMPSKVSKASIKKLVSRLKKEVDAL